MMLPSRPHQLIIARNVLNPDEVKFFLSNAPESTPVETLLLVAFGRWPIERLFEDSKSELGMDHFEVRKYLSIQRHLLLTCVSHLFLAEFVLERRGKKSGVDRLPGADSDAIPRPAVAARRTLFIQASRDDRGAIAYNANPKRPRSRLAPQANNQAFTGDCDQIEGLTHVQVEKTLVL